MTTATALQLIESALGKIGMHSVGETVSAEDADVCLERLNTLIDSLEGENMFAYATADTVFTLPANTESLTIGASQSIDMTRPARIMAGSFSRIDGRDYALRPVSEAQYNLISQKDNGGAIAPDVCFYDGGVPTGLLYFWPSVSAAVEVHLITPESSGEATDLTTAYAMAQGYRRYIEHALAVEIAPDFNVSASAQLVQLAASLKRILKRSNSRIPELEFEDAVIYGSIPLADKINGAW
jgi:hypothetical protein